MIDTTFDFRSDATSSDPDASSPTLRRYHALLWSKPLPNGNVFELSDGGRGNYLAHRGEFSTHYVSSDSIVHTYRTWQPGGMPAILAEIPTRDQDTFTHEAFTIGGMTIFPSNQVEGRPTINGARAGGRLADRFDLALECIRLFYVGESSPLAEVLERYASFFALFGSFRGYVNFFLLQDLVSENFALVNFMLPYSGFGQSGLPQSLDEYVAYRERAIEFLAARNQRIADWANSHLS